MQLPAPLLRRNKKDHKNVFGHVLVAAGSPCMLGAPCLVSLAAMRCGAGLVTAAIPKALNLTLQKKLAHAVMTLPVPGAPGNIFGEADSKALEKYWHKYTAVAIGPGLGTAATTRKFVQALVNTCPLPMVIDADALNALSLQTRKTIALKTARKVRILTPHAGEFYRLTGLKPVTDRERRVAARAYAVENKVIIVLKGHHTVVASPDGKVYVNASGNTGMAKAGMGDVLTGMIGALLAQGLFAFEAAKAAVYMHGLAGDRLLRRKHIYAFTADDLINEI